MQALENYDAEYGLEGFEPEQFEQLSVETKRRHRADAAYDEQEEATGRFEF